MGPVRQNPIQRTVSLFICVCIALCTIVAHNIAENRPDSFPPYPPDNHHISDDVYLREGGYDERYRRQTDGRAIAYSEREREFTFDSEREHEFTFAKNLPTRPLLTTATATYCNVWPC